MVTAAEPELVAIGLPIRDGRWHLPGGGRTLAAGLLEETAGVERTTRSYGLR